MQQNIYHESKKMNRFLNKKLIIFFILVIGFTLILKAQEFKYYTQYMFNGLAINPAYAGTSDFLNITGDIRKQWVGIDGAPLTQTVSAHSPIMNDQFGLGLIIINDMIGIISQQEFSMNYSYKINFTSYDLFLGMKVGFNYYRTQYDQLLLDNERDDDFQDNVRAFLPVAGLGVYMKATNYYAGISIPHLYKFVASNNKDININLHRLVFVTGGYIYRINSDWTVKPSVLTKANFGSIFEFDLNTNIYFKEDYCFGISYKSLNSLAFILEIGLYKSLFLSYSYDLATTSLIHCQSGTHEISFNIYLDRKGKTKIVNPRYF